MSELDFAGPLPSENGTIQNISKTRSENSSGQRQKMASTVLCMPSWPPCIPFRAGQADWWWVQGGFHCVGEGFKCVQEGIQWVQEGSRCFQESFRCVQEESICVWFDRVSKSRWPPCSPFRTRLTCGAYMVGSKQGLSLSLTGGLIPDNVSTKWFLYKVISPQTPSTYCLRFLV